MVGLVNPPYFFEIEPFTCVCVCVQKEQRIVRDWEHEWCPKDHSESVLEGNLQFLFQNEYEFCYKPINIYFRMRLCSSSYK